MADKRGETALITGASGGIGYELAKVFAEKGFNLVLIARNEQQLNKIANQLGSNITVKVLAKDLADPAASQQIYDQLAAENVQVDVLVNNAGFALYGPFAETNSDEELGMMNLNMVTLTRLTKLFLPGMIARRKGKILNIASTAAFQPGPLMAVYYATKAYVLFFSEALAEELRDTGVSVTALCPGPTASDFQKRASMEDSKLVKGKKLMDAATVARQGFQGLMDGKSVVIPGFMNRLTAFSIRLLPRGMVTRMVKNAQARAH